VQSIAPSVNIEAALAAHGEAVTLAKEFHFVLFTELTAAELCADYVAIGEWTQAATQARLALAARAEHSAIYSGMTHWCETTALIRAGDFPTAADDVRRFGERVGSSPRCRIAYLRAQAVVGQAQGDVARAIDGLDEARRLAGACGLGGEVRSFGPVLEALHHAQADVVRDAVC
jgi:hypothetical protein